MRNINTIKTPTSKEAGRLVKALPTAKDDPRESMARPAGWLRFETGWLSADQSLHNLETAVSLVQTIEEGLTGIGDILNDTMTDIHSWWNQTDRRKNPSMEHSIVLRQRIEMIDDIVRNTRFHGRGLLDGQSGVVGIGKGVEFIRGGPNTDNSPVEGFKVKIQGFPAKASLTGGVAIHEDWIKAEQEIFLAEGDRFIRFNPGGGGSITKFLVGLQEAVSLAGLDLEIGLTRQRRLIFRHNQYGTHFKFKGYSRSTPLLSKRPGRIEWCRKGLDIQGTLDGEPAFGVGRMLVGFLDNARTSELAVIWRGEKLEQDCMASCHVRQNGIRFQDGNGPERHQRKISLPPFYSRTLGRWVEGRSGFRSLIDVRADTWQELSDSMNMIFALSCELDEWKERASNWVQQYQNLALEILRNEVPILPKLREMKMLSQHQEVKQMVNAIQGLIQSGQRRAE